MADPNPRIWDSTHLSPVAREVSEPDSYGFLDFITADDGTGIRGGVGGGRSYPSYAVFYVGVPDVEAALQRAEASEVPGDGPASRDGCPTVAQAHASTTGHQRSPQLRP